MKNKKLLSTLFNLFIIAASLIVFSCNKEDEPVNPVKTKATKGLFVLNEGLFDQNNASLTYYDLDANTPTTDFFTIKNDRGLGDTGNDMETYGSKLYIVVTGSNQVEVVDSKTGVSIKQISMLNEEQKPRSPRQIAFHKNYAYVVSFDGTVGRMDTSSLVFDKFLTLGKNPNGICVANDKLYISNSGGLDFPNYDKTVSVVSTESFQELKRIEVVVNPNTILADKHGDVYVKSSGNYGDIAARLQVINSSTDEVTHHFENLPISGFAIGGDSAYVYSYDYGTKETKISVIDVKNEVVVSDKFITDNTTLTTPYGIDVDPLTGDVYITDVYDYVVTGDVHCFSKDGKQKFMFEAGLNPNKVVFIQE